MIMPFKVFFNIQIAIFQFNKQHDPKQVYVPSIH
jgi:hypothetical protein